ncbi:MAG: ABC transporter ATP-binding protein [Oscillospiraceae bacterium]|nr:ABC transporter ATP-binding protein [Oscillospiraceae bacterium]MDY2864603.1 ABC transporter ATP-binding protein [Oscillospiraceae bacterium]
MIQLTGVTKKFGDFTALDGVDLMIPKGTSFGLLGSNGAGKSTILRLLSGIYSAESGSVTIDGENVFDNVKVKERVFFINDETIQFGGFTLKDLKNYYKGFYPNFSDELFEELRETVKLPLDKKTERFSKGMKRQAIVITGLACQTDYLLLDEAFDGLDPTMRIIVKRMLVDAMLDRQLTTVISSHNLKEINEVCDSVALLHQGKMLFNRDLDSVKGSIHKVQAAFNEEYTREDFEKYGILHYSRSQSIHYIIMEGTEEEIREKLSEKNPIVLDLIPLTLEEIFIYEMEGMGYDAGQLD